MWQRELAFSPPPPQRESGQPLRHADLRTTVDVDLELVHETGHDVEASAFGSVQSGLAVRARGDRCRVRGPSRRQRRNSGPLDAQLDVDGLGAGTCSIALAHASWTQSRTSLAAWVSTPWACRKPRTCLRLLVELPGIGGHAEAQFAVKPRGLILSPLSVGHTRPAPHGSWEAEEEARTAFAAFATRSLPPVAPCEMSSRCSLGWQGSAMSVRPVQLTLSASRLPAARRPHAGRPSGGRRRPRRRRSPRPRGLHGGSTQPGYRLQEALVAEQLSAAPCLGDPVGVQHENIIVGKAQLGVLVVLVE